MKRDVCVVGGGVVGLCAVLAMHHRGFSVTLIDAGPLTVTPEEISPRVYAINHASQRLLQQLGAWAHLDLKRLGPYQHMHVWDSRNQAHLDFDARLIAEDQLGVILDESNLRHALLKEITQQKIPLYPENTVLSLKQWPDSIDICTEQGTWSTTLLIGVDGASSTIRRLFNLSLTTWPYHQEALVATVQIERPHQLTAYQVFNPDGTLAFLPLADSHHCSIVWASAPKRTQQRLALSEADFNEQLTEAFQAHLGEVRLCSTRHAFPLHMRHVKHYSGDHWVLMGDAAHTFHPLAGLGLNVGLADLTTFLTLLDATTDKHCTKRILGAYQRQRKYTVWQTIALMEGLKALFLNPLPPIVTLRKYALNGVDTLTELKRQLIRVAVG